MAEHHSKLSQPLIFLIVTKSPEFRSGFPPLTCFSSWQLSSLCWSQMTVETAYSLKEQTLADLPWFSATLMLNGGVSHWKTVQLAVRQSSCDVLIWLWCRASYCDGKLKGPPKPCAGNQGTQLLVSSKITWFVAHIEMMAAQKSTVVCLPCV